MLQAKGLNLKLSSRNLPKTLTTSALKQNHNSSGLTLVELVVVIAIAAILSSVAIPSFTTLYRTNQANAAIAEIKQALTFARISAMERGYEITLCASADQISCSQQWHHPLIVFKDSNDNRTIDGQETLLRSIDHSASYTLDWQAFGNKHYIIYSPIGTINHTNGSLTLCPADKNERYGKVLIINKGGRVRIALDTDNNGVVNRADGSDLDCG